MTSSVCNTVQTPVASATTSVTKDTYSSYGKSTSYIPETTLIDSRDNNTYRIRKLADGNCWMMDNLNLGATDLTVELSSTNSNFVSPLTAEVFNSWRVTTGSNTLTDGEFFNYTGNDPTSEGRYGTLYNYYAATSTYFSGSTTTQNSKKYFQR